MNKQAIIDAAIECFDLGPEDEDAVLGFGMKLEGIEPPDPDAHITEQEQYLKTKQERAKDVDFDGIETAASLGISDGLRAKIDHVNGLVEKYAAKERPTAPEEQAENRYPYPEGIGQWSRADREHFLALCKPNRAGYAAALTERALPAEEALRLAMDYINGIRGWCTLTALQRLQALRANPLAAKMLEE